MPPEKIITIPFTSKSYTKIEITRLLTQILPRETHHPKNQKVIYNCVKPNSAIQIFQNHFHFGNTYEAIEFARQLKEFGVLHCIDEEGLFEEGLWRLQPFHTPNVLNTFILVDKGEEEEEEDVFEMIHGLYNVMQQIEQDAKDKNENINYAKLTTNNPSLSKLEEDLCGLQILSLRQLLNDGDKILAFFINLYNIIIKYAFWKVGIPSTMYQRHAFHDGISMNVGGHVLSLNYIYHTILRCNNNTITSNDNLRVSMMKNISSISHSISHSMTACTTSHKDDVLDKLTLTKLDPRIHFALIHTPIPLSNIPFYSSTMIDDQLQTATQNFCEQFKNVFIDEDSFNIHLSQIFKWYKSDFCLDEHFEVLLTYLTGKKKHMLLRMMQKEKKGLDIDVKYVPFDWDYCGGVGVIDRKEFDRECIIGERFTMWGKMNGENCL